MSEKKNRYPGVLPFTEKQENLFFGREKDIENLKNLILLRKQVLLYSKSGIGKTSLLNAGVLPKIKQEFTTLNIRFTTWTEKKQISPAQVILKKLKEEGLKNDQKPEHNVLDRLLVGESYEEMFWYYFKKEQFQNPQKKYLLVFDQFEELFTYPKEQIDEFKNQLYEITEVDIPDLIIQKLSEKSDFEDNDELEILYEPLKIKTVFSIRSDRISKLNLLSDKISNIQRDFYELKPLTRDQAKQAIVNPAEINSTEFKTKPFRFDEEVADKIIDQLTTKHQEGSISQPIETTQLQIVCQRIEDNLNRRNLTPNEEIAEFLAIHIEDIPNFKNIFLDFYNDAVQKVKSDKLEDAYRFIEYHMIIGGRRISLDGLVCRMHVNRETLQVLVDSHLLRAEPNNVGGYSYELSHDTLVPPIQEAAEERKKKEKESYWKRQRIITGIFVFVALLSFSFLIWALYSRSEMKKSEKIAIENQRAAEKAKFEAEKKNKELLLAKNEKSRMDSIYQEAISINRKQYDSIRSLYALQNITISSDNINSLYFNVRNPFSLLVRGNAIEYIRLSSSEGRVEVRDEINGQYYIIPNNTRIFNLEIRIQQLHIPLRILRKQFLVKDLPNPEVRLSIGSEIVNSSALDSAKLIITPKDDLNSEFKLLSYSVLGIGNDGFVKDPIYGNSPSLPKKIKEYIINTKKEKPIFFDEIKVRGPDNTIRKLPGFSIKWRTH